MGGVMGWTVFSHKFYVEVVTPSSLESDLERESLQKQQS